MGLGGCVWMIVCLWGYLIFDMSVEVIRIGRRLMKVTMVDDHDKLRE